ncbi:heterokaryon incompatibility protein-domain-containing protein [Xylaria acuta]|nr:heterokaryon incompatibility protein-domain-containing protein [Xylaria acuta]
MRLINVQDHRFREFPDNKTPPYAILSHTWQTCDHEIDSCCINKRDSKELSTAINSMFNWYEKADVCFAFLEDVSLDGDWKQEFKNYKWLTRGWTLQELLAPTTVQFYDKNWQLIGTRNENPIFGLLADITGISSGALSKELPLEDFSAAQKMSWAAERKTTEAGDIAYCLFGIFRIDIRIVYGGEGERTAFRRL